MTFKICRPAGAMELHLGLSIIQINEEFRVNVIGLNCVQLWILNQYLGYLMSCLPQQNIKLDL